MAEDRKENQMTGGIPVRLRGLDANGNSISPTMEEVAKVMPKRNEISVDIPDGEGYYLSVAVYNTLFVYETSSIGVGCMVLLGWTCTNIIGHSVFSNSDIEGKICIYNVANGKYAIKNRTIGAKRLTINVV